MLLDLSQDTYGRTSSAAPATPHVAPVIQLATRATDLLTPQADWDWREVRDYVLRQLAERRIPFREMPAERLASIFKGFSKRWGTQAGPIARFAFEQCDGYWNDAPIVPTRFCAGSDPYFAEKIASRLVAA